MARFPSWGEFTGSVATFKGKCDVSLKKFKNDHPMLDKAILSALPFLPEPFNAIATQVYGSAQGTSLEKSNEVLSYLTYLESRGQKNYEQLATKLDAVLVDVASLKEISAKEETVEQIREILLSSGKSTENRLEDLKTSLVSIDTTVSEIKEGQKAMQSDIDVIKQQLVILVGREQQTLEQVNIQPTIIEKKKKHPEITQEIAKEIEEILEEKEELEDQLEELGEKQEINIPLTISEANFHHHVGHFDNASDLYDKVLEVEPENEIAKKNKELTVGRIDKYFGKQRTFKNKNVKLLSLAKELEQFFHEQKFSDVLIEEDPDGKWFDVQAKKGGIGATLSNTRKAIHVLIQGKPERFQVEMTTGEWGKNIALGAIVGYGLTMGISSGIGMAKNIKFKNKLWKYIEDSVDKLLNTKESSKSSAV